MNKCLLFLLHYLNLFRYYMVEETNDSSCLNYKQIRHQFEEYDLSDLFETPKKNTTPKVSSWF